MAHRIDDRWIWFGFGVFFFVAAKGIRYAIQDVVQLTKIDSEQLEAESKDESEHPEDTISLENVRTLVDSPNPNISNAAISVVMARFARLPNALRLLTKDYHSEDDETHVRAARAIVFLKYLGGPSELQRNLPMPPTLPDSPSDSPPPGVRLTTAELARRLGGDGGVAGGDGWVGNWVVPSERNPVAGWTNIPRERPVEDDAEESERRRRRREAMVLHEGGGVLREDDIIRPRP